MAFQDVIIPGANAVILTDANRTVGIYATARSPFGTMLSHDATELLVNQWFGDERAEALRSVGELRAQSSDVEIEEFVRTLHPSLALSAGATAVRPLEVRRMDAAETLNVEGLRPVSLGPGRMMRRSWFPAAPGQVGGVSITLHEAEEPLDPNLVPQLSGLMAFDASMAQLPQDLQIRRAQVIAANNCAGCAGCAVCAGCVFCAEVNFSVGAAGFVGLAGLAGLASSVAIATRS